MNNWNYLKRIQYFLVVVGSILIVMWVLYAYYTSTPSPLLTTTNFVVEEGQNLRTISENLQKAGLLRSPLLFRVWVSFTGYDTQIQLGEYIFDKPLSLSDTVHKIAFGKPDKPLISVTIPEGSTISQIAVLLQKVLPVFSTKVFMEEVTKNNAEGRLFPSTYFLLPSTTESQVVTMLTDTFETQYNKSFANSSIPKPLTTRIQVLSLAAIIEEEAKHTEDMHMIAGILLKRLSIGMALQVDVAKETYTERGLPDTPISNPGVTAINAVFTPETSPYLYYLTGNDGVMYYAKTFDEHKQNIRKHLK